MNPKLKSLLKQIKIWQIKFHYMNHLCLKLNSKKNKLKNYQNKKLINANI